MVHVNPTISISTLDLNSLNQLIKKRKLAEQVKNNTQLYIVYKRHTLNKKEPFDFLKGMEKDTPCQH